MKFKILVLVLGNYLSLSKYLEGIDLSFEDKINKIKSGDLFSIYLEHGENYSIEVEGDEINYDRNRKIQSQTDFEISLDKLMQDNPCRYPSVEDYLGLYTGSTLKLKTPEQDEEIDVNIVYNFLVKGDEPTVQNPDALYIIDNPTLGLATYGQIVYLIRKYGVSTQVYTCHDLDDYRKSIQAEFEDDIDVEVDSLDF